MAWIWTGMAVLSILCGLATGRGELVAAAAVEGAQAAVELCVSIAGMLCLWTGVMEVMRRSGLAEGLSRLLRPVLSLLFPQVSGDRGVLNTASIQLIPTTVASVRAAAGSSSPFDILPAVWLASALSVGVGIAACKLLARIWRD